jgi:uncharacterized protein (TIGR02266 family)
MGSAKILIVDDDRHTRETLRDFLAAKGAVAIVAETGFQAVDLVVEEKPDVVILDVQMRGLGGFGTLARLRELAEGKDLPVVMMSAVYKDEASRQTAMGPLLKASDYLYKPIALGEVWQRVSRLCASPTATRKSQRYDTAREVALHCSSWAQFVKLYSKDISHGGIFVQTLDPPPLRTAVVVRLSLPAGGGVVELGGEVVQIVPAERASALGLVPGMGIQFGDLTPEMRQALEAVVADVASGRAPDPQRLRGVGVVPAVATKPETAVATETPASPTPPTLSAEDTRLCHALAAELARLKSQDYLGVLQLGPSADADAVKRAFLALSRRYHPDACVSRTPQVMELVQEIYLTISKAYDELRKPGVLAKRPSRVTTAVPPPPDNATEPALPRPPSGEWPMATFVAPPRPSFASPPPEPASVAKDAIPKPASVSPGSGPARRHSGEWPKLSLEELSQEAMAQMKGGNHAQASALFGECVKRAPTHVLYRAGRTLCLGYLAEKAEQPDEALEQFKKVLILEPKNEEAREAVRRLEKSRSGKAGLMGRLWTRR